MKSQYTLSEEEVVEAVQSWLLNEKGVDIEDGTASFQILLPKERSGPGGTGIGPTEYLLIIEDE